MDEDILMKFAGLMHALLAYFKFTCMVEIAHESTKVSGNRRTYFIAKCLLYNQAIQIYWSSSQLHISLAANVFVDLQC